MTPAITNNRQPLTKDPGSLTHILRSQNSPEASGSDGVHVRQYILLGGETDQNKYLLIRFINASDRVVNGLMFTVDQLDGNGSVLASSECAFRGLSLTPGQLYTPERALLMSPDCADVRVRVSSYDSGLYRYTVAKDGMTVSYIAPTSGQVMKNDQHGQDAAVHKLPVGQRHYIGHVLIAAFAVLILTAYVVLYEYTSGPVHTFFGEILPGALRAFFGDILPNALRSFFGVILPNALRAFFGDILPNALRSFFGNILPGIFRTIFKELIPNVFRQIRAWIK